MLLRVSACCCMRVLYVFVRCCMCCMVAHVVARDCMRLHGLVACVCILLNMFAWCCLRVVACFGMMLHVVARVCYVKCCLCVV